MKHGLMSGILWGLDTVILGIGLALAPYVGTAEALAFAEIPLLPSKQGRARSLSWEPCWVVPLV